MSPNESRFSSKAEENPRGAGGPEGENYEGDDETSMAEPLTSCKRRAGRSTHMQQVLTKVLAVNTAL